MFVCLSKWCRSHTGKKPTRKKIWNARYCLICVVFRFDRNSGHFWVAHWILAFHILQTIYSLSFTHTLARSVIPFDLESLSHCPFHFDVSFYIYLIRISLKWNWKTFFSAAAAAVAVVVIVVANDDFKYFLCSSPNSFTLIRTHIHTSTYTDVCLQCSNCFNISLWDTQFCGKMKTSSQQKRTTTTMLGFHLNSVQWQAANWFNMSKLFLFARIKICRNPESKRSLPDEFILASFWRGGLLLMKRKTKRKKLRVVWNNTQQE